jgi:DNA-binding NarL/FixJ family response regulator
MSDAAVRVLVCDDHEVFADGVAALLRAEGMDVVRTLGRARDVVPSVLELHPDVVLMDYELPDADGVETTAEVKSADPSVHVVLLTASTDESVLVRAIDAGISGYVTKTKPTAEVMGAIRAAVAGDVVVSPDMLVRLLPRLRSRPSPTSRYDLTPREVEVLELLAEGASNEVLVRELGISRNTVRNHVQNLLTKLGVHSRLEAVALATREGLLRSGG